MIETITGIIKATRDHGVVISIGPIDIAFSTPIETVFTLNDSATVFTYFHWNQEQGPALYGFVCEEDRTIFSLIISCSGLGPRIGLAVLRDLGTHGFITAIEAHDERMLSKVNGIGLKKAEQIIVQLKHKVAQLVTSGIVLDSTTEQTHWHTVQQALGSLNYSRTEITRALAHIKESNSQEVSFDQLFRKALSFLSKQP